MSADPGTLFSHIPTPAGEVGRWHKCGDGWCRHFEADKLMLTVEKWYTAVGCGGVKVSIEGTQDADGNISDVEAVLQVTGATDEAYVTLEADQTRRLAFALMATADELDEGES